MYDPAYPSSYTGMGYVHYSRQFTGKGIRIAIIDTGVDYTHIALGGNFGERYTVAYGRSYIRTGPNKEEIFENGNDPKDCLGHGTAVAGIIGARTPTFTGVAPDAKLGAYRVMHCTQATSRAIVAQAITDAVDDNSNIINMSALLHLDEEDDTIEKAIDYAVSKGVVIVASAGNNNAKQSLPGGNTNDDIGRCSVYTD
ncbi:peptidase S8/S53 domain-containing protein [Syncephalis plumigaleata]|nr:peptidase S8/S53 domain-containing protein [Syncephalis plumigaleata]